MSPASGSPAHLGLPLVVQLGFVGSRRFLDAAAHPGVNAAQFETALQPLLTGRLSRLPAEFGLDPQRHPVCGVSSLAIGGDTLFARSCQTLGWPHRIFLPQVREDFLAATGSGGARDFTDAEAADARALLAGPNVIQEHVVSESPDRHERFEDVNLELIRVCDLLVVLVRAGADGQPGGSLDALAQAQASERTVLELRVSVDASGQPQLDEGTWHHHAAFTAPALPHELTGLQTSLTGLPPVADYCHALQQFGRTTSRARQRFFKLGALVVVAAHVVATLCAVLALKLHGAAALPWILGGELLLLALGFGAHHWLHVAHAVRVWAMSRLVAEIAHSTAALRDVPAPLGHLSTLPLPGSLRTLLRTLNVLHLRDARTLPPGDWITRRDTYVADRLSESRRGQIPYYGLQLGRADRRRRWARGIFLFGSLGAFAATTLKLLLVCHCLPVPEGWHDAATGGLGALAILLPVLAVAALSLAAAYDLEARAETFRETLAFLQGQEGRLRRAPTEHAFRHLALETESRLLGETAAWHARRAFTGIA